MVDTSLWNFTIRLEWKIPSMCVPTCVCFHVNVSMSAYVCIYIWNPDVDIKCLLCFLPYFLRLGHSLNLELINTARLAGLWVPGIHQSLPRSTGIVDVPAIMTDSTKVLEIYTQVLMPASILPVEPSPTPLKWKRLGDWSESPVMCKGVTIRVP